MSKTSSNRMRTFPYRDLLSATESLPLSVVVVSISGKRRLESKQSLKSGKRLMFFNQMTNCSKKLNFISTMKTRENFPGRTAESLDTIYLQAADGKNIWLDS